MKKEATYKGYKVVVEDDNSITATLDGKVCDNVKQALRDIAEQTGWTYDAGWNTRQLGAKLVDFLNAQPAAGKSESKSKNKCESKCASKSKGKSAKAADTNTGGLDKDTIHLLSKVFAALAYATADIDDEVTQEEIDWMNKIASQVSFLDKDVVGTYLDLERKHICSYKSHTELAKLVPPQYRIPMYQTIVMVVLADCKVRNIELEILSGLADIWEIGEERANFLINQMADQFEHNVAAKQGRSLEIE